MKLFVLTMAHIDRMSTHEVLRNCPYDVYWVTHFHDDRLRLNGELGIPKSNIITHGLSRNDAKALGPAVCAWIRDWICDNLLKLGDWYIMMDDDVREIWSVSEEFYYQDRIRFEDELPNHAHSEIDGELVRSAGDWWRKKVFRTNADCYLSWFVEEIKEQCESLGTIMGGFSHAENYYFRRNKWSFRHIIPGTFILRQHDGERWLRYPHIAHEDVVMSYVTVARYGSNVSNKFVYADTRYGAEGGIGSLEKRMPNLIKTADSMHEEFPGLFKNWKGRPEALKVKFHSLKGIRQWQREQESVK